MHGAVQFTVYDELKYLAARWGPRAPGQEGEERRLGSGELSLFAASSKLTASVTTYPSQVGRMRGRGKARGEGERDEGASGVGSGGCGAMVYATSQ